MIMQSWNGNYYWQVWEVRALPITKTQKIKISRMVDSGINQRDIAAKYGISVSYVKKIRREVKSQDLEEESIWDRCCLLYTSRCV